MSRTVLAKARGGCPLWKVLSDEDPGDCVKDAEVGECRAKGLELMLSGQQRGWGTAGGGGVVAVIQSQIVWPGFP